MAAGKTYRGTALVVDEWYVTAYQPLKDAAGRVVGMLYVGVPQQGISTLRDALLGEKVGEHGSVHGPGRDRRPARAGAAQRRPVARGHVACSRSRTPAATRWVEQAVDLARELPAGELATVRYDDAEDRPAHRAAGLLRARGTGSSRS